jgi:hypothetical protein
MRRPSLSLIGLFLVWGIIWAIPALREQTLIGKELLNSKNLFRQRPSLEQQLVDSPDDPYVQHRKIELQRDNLKPAEYFRAYDALIAKYPNQMFLRRSRLRSATRGPLVSDRRASQYDDSYVRPSGAREKPAKVWLDDAQLQAMAQQAHRSGELEPDDAFFPFMEAMALWSLHREPDALAALDRAGKCSEFNDGTTEESRIRFKHFSKYIPYEWDEKFLVSSLMLFPHLGSMRNLIREVCYSGVEEYKTGNKEEAWRRWKIALEVGRAVRRSESHGPEATLIGLLVAEALESMNFSIVAKQVAGYSHEEPQFNDDPDSYREKFKKQLRANMAAYVRLAKRDGQMVMSRLAQQERQEIIARRDDPVFRQTVDSFNSSLGWKSPWARLLVQIRWFGWRALLLSGCGVLGLALTGLITRGGRESQVGKSTVWSLSSFWISLWLGIGIWAGIMGAGLATYPALLSLQGSEGDPYGTDNLDWESKFWWLLAFTILGAIILTSVGRYRAGRSRPVVLCSRAGAWSAAQMSVWLIVLLLSVMLWAEGLGLTKIDLRVVGSLWISAVILALFLTWWNDRAQGPGSPSSFQMACCTALGLGSSVTVIRVSSDASVFAGVIMGLATLLLLARNFRHSWPGFRAFLPSLRAPLEACGRVMANLALAVSLCYLIGSLVLLPKRSELNRNVDRYIQMGEMDWIRAQKPL